MPPRTTPPPAPALIAGDLLERADDLRRVAQSILTRAGELVEIAEQLSPGASVPSGRAPAG